MNRSVLGLGVLLALLAILLATRGENYTWVQVEGTKMRLLSTGHGRPTVIFESGAGGSLDTWLRIQPAVSRFARTISYDRAGNGLSEKSSQPRDGLRIAAELHGLLHELRAEPPYLLVGHSLGGPFIRLFAALYPEEVTGLVLVDPTQEDLIAWAKSREPKEEHPPNWFREEDCAPRTFEQLRTNALPPNLPVALIAGMGPKTIPSFLSEKFKAEVTKDQQTLYPAKLKFYRQWVQTMPLGRLIVSEESGHGIPFEQPELVVQTIREMVESRTARSRSGL